MTEDQEAQLAGALSELEARRQMLAAAASLVAHHAQEHPTDADVTIRGRLHEMEYGALGKQSADIFEDFCAAVLAAYPDDHASDGSILANASTPDLIRYLTASLRRYATTRTAAPRPNNDQFAAAFLRNNGRGAPGRLLQIEEQVVTAGVGAYWAARHDGADLATAYECAKGTAYRAFRRGANTKQKKGDKEAAERRIGELLALECIERPAGSDGG